MANDAGLAVALAGHRQAKHSKPRIARGSQSIR